MGAELVPSCMCAKREKILTSPKVCVRDRDGARTHGGDLSSRAIIMAEQLQDQDPDDEAEPLDHVSLHEALEASREVHGDRHPATLTALNNLAMLLQDQGRYDEAEPLSREALDASREVHGARHPATLEALNNVARVLQAQGRWRDLSDENQNARAFFFLVRFFRPS